MNKQTSEGMSGLRGARMSGPAMTSPSRGRSVADAPAHVQALPAPHLVFSDPLSFPARTPRGPCLLMPLRGARPLPEAPAATAARLSCSATVWPLRGSPLPASSLGSVQTQVSGKKADALWPRAQCPGPHVSSALKPPKVMSQPLIPCSPTSALTLVHRVTRRPGLPCSLYEVMILLC